MQAITKRKVDELGRVVLPIELRTNLGIEPEDDIDICTDEDGKIILQKAVNQCDFCKGIEDITKFMGKYICLTC